ncbi:MAG: cysteine desulfurase family protein [Bdellovibrionales bacterium]
MSSLYFDYCASTPVDARVKEAMEPYWNQQFGNPASLLHTSGWQAQAAVQSARKKVAQLLNCSPEEVVFTSGATESNNWALKGLVYRLKKLEPTIRPHVITTPFEHSSVAEVLKFLTNEELIELSYAPVDAHGLIQLADLNFLLKPNTRILSVMWCQNEIGSQQNIEELAQWSKNNNLILHSDATQMVGKYPIDLKTTPVDLLSFSGHKIYGPKGIGALFIRKEDPRLKLNPLLHGGFQEPLGRSGTLNVPGIVALGRACEVCEIEMAQDLFHAQTLHSHFYSELKKNFSDQILFNSPELQSSKYLINITVPRLSADDLLPRLARLCLSTGSACRSSDSKLSPALKALGRGNLESPATHLRISWGRMTRIEEAHEACEILVKSLKSLGFCNLASSHLQTSQLSAPMVVS